MYNGWVNKQTEEAFNLLCKSETANKKVIPMLVSILGMSNSSQFQLRSFLVNKDDFLTNNFDQETKTKIEQINIEKIDLKQILYVYCAAHARHHLTDRTA